MIENIFERLREERKRLGKTPDQVIVETGINKSSYYAYESGKTEPSSKLLALLVPIGFDVLYILTGQRSIPVESRLSDRERALLANYEASDEAGKKHIETTASLLSQRDKDKQA